ncbi:glycosyltransferase, partial [Blautia pseudococcoides]|nr:glycosyltransferase [Blautia pseudococcoides]
MKILITTDWYKPIVNGVVTSVLNLKRELEERGHEVRVLTLSETGASYKDNEVYYVKSIDLGSIYPNARAVLPYSNPYISELIDWEPDVVHSQCEFMTFQYASKISRKCGCPLLHTYHTIYADYMHYLPGVLGRYTAGRKAGKKAAAEFSRTILNRTDRVIAPTGKVKDILSIYQVKPAIDVIPSGIDLRKF